MNTGLFVTSGLFILLGLISTINPLFAFNLRAWFARQVMEMEIRPGARTLLAYRLLGIAFIIIGTGMFLAQLR